MAIVVPFSDDPKPNQGSDESYMLMAAANMHAMGRLVEPDTKPETGPGPSSRREQLALAQPSTEGATDPLTQRVQRELERRDPGERTPAEEIEERFPQAIKSQERVGGKPTPKVKKPDRSLAPMRPGQWVPDPSGLGRTVRGI